MDTKTVPSVPSNVVALGECVVAWREYRGISGAELSRRANVPRNSISSIEHNVIKQPNEKRLAAIAAALDIDFYVLWNRQLPPGPDEKVDSNQVGNTLGAIIDARLQRAQLSRQELQIVTNSTLTLIEDLLEFVKISRQNGPVKQT